MRWQLNDVLSLGLHRVWKRAAVKWSGAAAGHTALDVCCGSGDLAFLLAEAVGAEGQACCPPQKPQRKPCCLTCLEYTCLIAQPFGRSNVFGYQTATWEHSNLSADDLGTADRCLWTCFGIGRLSVA